MTESFSNDKELWFKVAMNQSFSTQKEILLNGLTDHQLTEINFKLSLLSQDENFIKFKEMHHLWNVNLRADSLLNEIDECVKQDTTYQESQQQQEQRQQQMAYMDSTSTTYDAPIGPPNETEEQFQQPQPQVQQPQSPFVFFDMFTEEFPYNVLDMDPWEY
ncbi:unnamed protein product [Ambrosiozyma monospora]|uniref:Unnamed protein product n=1 Tax=Ambrosiozyma monospora TaxID=43982 RepID=A0A9W6Z354_AMBMO|nr:unnamed protein product [Ambrosiozyma monospora]